MEDEDCGEMVLPMTPRTGLNTNADEDRCSEELMTPRSLSKRLEKPDIKDKIFVQEQADRRDLEDEVSS